MMNSLKAHGLKPGSRIYFLAICGTGMSALASLMKSRGCIVAGSDIASYPPVGDFLRTSGIPVDIGYDVEKLKAFKPDYVVIGNFIRRDNPQAQFVLDSNIPYGSFPSTLEDIFLEQTQNFVVVGTHGKSTTTICLAHLLAQAKRDPSYLVGGIPINFSSSAHLGEGKDFVIEGDEYDTAFFDKESKFLHYRPTYGLMMSLEWDHADIFPTPAAMEKMFRKFMHIVDAKRGAIVHCADWARLTEILNEEKPAAKRISFGFSESADHRISDFRDGEGGMTFTLRGQRFENSMTGKFNAQNFAAAILSAHEAGVSLDPLAQGLKSFKGLKRRQEVRAQIGKHLVIDDFAHHPTAVDEVVRGLKSKYPHHQLVVFFEPRSNTSRRAVLQDKFDRAFENADVTLLAPVFKIEALPENDRLDIPRIVNRLSAMGKKAFGPVVIDEMTSIAKKMSTEGPCLFLVLSNGSFDGLHEKLISALKEV